jgi:tetratricopeptide (TPR) repeat protein
MRKPRTRDRKSSSVQKDSNSFGEAGLWVSLFLGTFLAYLPALQGGLLWDDSSHVTKPELQSLHGLWRIWFDLGATQQYYPLLHSAFWIEHRIWGDAVAGYHLTNIVLHTLAACLVMMVVRRLSLPGAWLAAFIFALHPACVEAVAWISEQKSTLSAVFYLGAAFTYLGFDQTRRRSRYFLALGLFVLALMTKTVTATLPGALLVILWWKRGRLEWRRDVLPLVPWFALGATAGIFTAWVEWKLIGARGVEFELNAIQRILLAGRVIWFYFAKLIWPANLIFTYPHWKIDTEAWWQYLFPIGVVAVGIGLWRMARRNRGPLAGFLLFAGTLFPVLGFLNVYPFRISYVADHFQYLASLGIIVPVACGLTVAAGWFSRESWPRWAVAMLVMVLGVLTWRQSGIYRDVETLYRETLASNPSSWMAHNNLGKVLAELPGRLPDAIAEYEAALRIYPDFAEGHNNLGNALSHVPGMLPDAIAELETALRLAPDYAKAHYNLGNVLSQVPGRLQDAIAQYQAALRVQADLAEAHNNLGNALLQKPGKLPDAIAEYQAAVRIDPNSAEAHNNLANALSQMPGRAQEAIAECELALRINPDFAEAHNNLGNILSQLQGRLPDAMIEYQAALRIAPNYAEAHNNLGSGLAQTPGRLPDAIAEFETALRINPNYAVARANLESARQILNSRPQR